MVATDENNHDIERNVTFILQIRKLIPRKLRNLCSQHRHLQLLAFTITVHTETMSLCIRVGHWTYHDAACGQMFRCGSKLFLKSTPGMNKPHTVLPKQTKNRNMTTRKHTNTQEKVGEIARSSSALRWWDVTGQSSTPVSHRLEWTKESAPFHTRNHPAHLHEVLPVDCLSFWEKLETFTNRTTMQKVRHYGNRVFRHFFSEDHSQVIHFNY